MSSLNRETLGAPSLYRRAYTGLFSGSDWTLQWTDGNFLAERNLVRSARQLMSNRLGYNTTSVMDSPTITDTLSEGNSPLHIKLLA